MSLLDITAGNDCQPAITTNVDEGIYATSTSDHNAAGNMDSANKWVPAGDVVVAQAPVAVAQTDKWVYTKGLLMTIEGARLKAHMIQTLYRKAKESELGGWSIPFTSNMVRDALHISLQKSIPTFEASHRSKFPEITDDEGIEAFFNKIKANFEKGRLKTYMRETTTDAATLSPPSNPEGPEPDLEMTDSKIIHHKTWLQNYAWFVCQWMDRSGRTIGKKRTSISSGQGSPSIATPSRKRQRTSMGGAVDHFAGMSTNRTANLSTLPGMSTSNLESLTTGSQEDAIVDTLQFGFKCLFSMIAVSTAPQMGSIDRMRMVTLNMLKEAEEMRQGAKQERAKQTVKSMREAIDASQQMY